MQFPGNKYNINCAASTPEPAMRFRQDKISYVLEKTGEHDISQTFACYRQKGNATTVAKFCSLTVMPVHKNNVGIYPLQRETYSGTAVKDKIMQPSVYHTPTMPNDLSRMSSGPSALLSLRLRMASYTSSKDGGS